MGSSHSSEAEKAKLGTMGRLSEDMLLYRLVDMHGGGELIPWMRYAHKTGDHSIIDGFIDIRVREFLYKGGEGKLVTVTELVKIRNKQRNAMLSAFSRKKGKGKSGPNVLDAVNQEGVNAGDVQKILKLVGDGGGKGKGGESKYRDICWKLEERGSMGETLLGVCLLQGTSIHNMLALKLLDNFPKLVNDFNVSEDYYGLSPLHQAIVNEDPYMVSVLLRRGADVSKRCFGAFFCTEDQKTSRTDSMEHEAVDLSPKTNYTGRMYFGEYPLHFAACMNQPECYRLLLVKKANPNAQDTNGNTVLHMCVIHENMDMLRLAVQTGASLRITNKQGLTPLTLAAKLAKKKIFIELLDLESDVVWAYGEASQTAYPLADIDTINEKNGEMNEQSALSLVVYGETAEHLELLDGLLENILQAKWDAYAKTSWYRSLASFSFYYICFFMAYMNRPFSYTTQISTNGMVNQHGEPLKFSDMKYKIDYNRTLVSTDDLTRLNYYQYTNLHYDELKARCHLINYAELPLTQGWIRLGAEVLVLVQVIIQIAMDVLDIRRIGRKKWWNVMVAFPAKLIWKMTFFGIFFIVPLRAACHLSMTFVILDNVISTILVPMTTIHFLYYSRAVKFVGPFVLMIYTIIASDLSRFIAIYLIFLIGFSQSFYLIFTACERAEYENSNVTATLRADDDGDSFQNLLPNPQEALIRTFIMTIGEFMSLYRELAACNSLLLSTIGKICFIIFELGVSILQFNLLIAMMTRTYEEIFQTSKEWKRQWAQVILMLELSVAPKKRLHHMQQYSRPRGTQKDIRAFVVIKKNDDDDEVARQVRQEKRERMHEEKMALIRKKQREIEREGAAGRPVTRRYLGGESNLEKSRRKSFAT
ncbi:unnamed protein product, partial [Mesorhabditis belari]|uniref:Ion transport domain-containing protein n=1 Tax=Mesorhabditis belari TaxID=2138241 RepID=A0AAF3FQJ7_9BILA